MTTLLVFVGWCLLLVLAWPVAIAVLLLAPLVWLLTLPFRLMVVVFDAMFALLRALFMLPARLLGYRGP